MPDNALSRTRAISRLERMRASLRSIRDQAKETASRVTVVAAVEGGAYGGGWLAGWAERTGKDMTIGDSTVTWTLAGGLGAAILGAALPRQIGEQAADLLMGLGAGVAAADVALSGYRSGLKPPTE